MILNNRRSCQWVDAKKLASVSAVPISVWMDGPGEWIVKHIDRAAAEGKGILAGSRDLTPPTRPFFCTEPEGR